MKFSQLAIGEAFSYQGCRYIKSGPLMATEQDNGKERLMMRAAQVSPIEKAADGTALNTNDLQQQLTEIERQLEHYHLLASSLIDNQSQPLEDLDNLHQKLLDLLRALPTSFKGA